MTALQKIQKEAAKIRAAKPSLKYTDAIKIASKNYNAGKLGAVKKKNTPRLPVKKIVTTVTKEKVAGQLSPYTVYWFALIPVRGKVPLKDRRLAYYTIFNVKGFSMGSEYSIFDHAKDSNTAKERVKKLQNILSKDYKAYIFTDKQFGLANSKGDLRINFTNNKIPLTQQQKNSVVFIQKK